MTALTMRSSSERWANRTILESVAALTPDDAFELLGGRIPSGFDFTFRAPDHLVGVATGNWTPQLLEGVLENLTLQIEAAPPEIWQR